MSSYDVDLNVEGRGSGRTVPANDELIEEMKNDKSFKTMINDLQDFIGNKIDDDKIENGIAICNAPGSRRGISCNCLGSYSVNIEYSFIPNYGDNIFSIHFFGYDQWDFEWNDQKRWLHNFFNETLPSIEAGEGEPFDITYDFYYEICVTY